MQKHCVLCKCKVLLLESLSSSFGTKTFCFIHQVISSVCVLAHSPRNKFLFLLVLFLLVLVGFKNLFFSQMVVETNVPLSTFNKEVLLLWANGVNAWLSFLVWAGSQFLGHFHYTHRTTGTFLQGTK